jgi:DNA-binding IclR family transcriptional regulator
VLAQEESPNPFRLSVEVGSTHSPLRTNSGRLLLAALAQPALDGLLARSGEWQAMTAASRRKTQGRLATICADGHAESIGERFLGSADVGVLIGSPRAPLNAALTIATLIEVDGKPRHERLLEPLHRAAEAISHAAGLTLGVAREPLGAAPTTA